MEREPEKKNEKKKKFPRSLTLVPRSLLRNRTETLAAQANKISRVNTHLTVLNLRCVLASLLATR